MSGGFRILKLKVGSTNEEITINGDNGAEGMINNFPVLIGPKCITIKNKAGSKRFVPMATLDEISKSDILKKYVTPIRFKKAKKPVLTARHFLTKNTF